jgi:hypothetical protein
VQLGILFCLFVYCVMGVSIDQTQSTVKVAPNSVKRTANWKSPYIISHPLRYTTKILGKPVAARKKTLGYLMTLRKIWIQRPSTCVI